MKSDINIISLLSEGSILLYKVAFTNEDVQTWKVVNLDKNMFFLLFSTPTDDDFGETAKETIMIRVTDCSRCNFMFFVEQSNKWRKKKEI